MSRNIVVLEKISTGGTRYIGGNPSAFTIVSDRSEAISFKAEHVVPALRFAKKDLNPNETRVFTASA